MGSIEQAEVPQSATPGQFLGTIVVCSYNGARKLPAGLDSIDKQSIRQQLDVVVVDDGSTDGTHDVASRPGVRVVRHDVNRGLAAARNTGLEAAQTDLVLFTDDDCRLPFDWAEKLISLANRHPQAFAVGGSLSGQVEPGLINLYLRGRSPFEPLEESLLESDGFVHRLQQYLRRSARSTSDGRERRVSSLLGGHMALRVATVKRLGGWDERFRFGGEEEDLFRRAVRAGESLWFEPEITMVHEFENSLRSVLYRSRWYGRGNARMYAKHGGLPTLYPAPVLVAALLMCAPRSRAALIAAALLPQLVFSGWGRLALRHGNPAFLLCPYIQVLQEAASNVGWLQGWHRDRALFDEDHP